MTKIEDIAKCSCGAITVFFENGADNSMTVETFKKVFGKDPETTLNDYGNCNHCVNHWGVDLCGCGSGEEVGKCDRGFSECKAGAPAQYLEQSKEIIGWKN